MLQDGGPLRGEPCRNTGADDNQNHAWNQGDHGHPAEHLVVADDDSVEHNTHHGIASDLGCQLVGGSGHY